MGKFRLTRQDFDNSEMEWKSFKELRPHSNPLLYSSSTYSIQECENYINQVCDIISSDTNGAILPTEIREIIINHNYFIANFLNKEKKLSRSSDIDAFNAIKVPDVLGYIRKMEEQQKKKGKSDEDIHAEEVAEKAAKMWESFDLKTKELVLYEIEGLMGAGANNNINRYDIGWAYALLYNPGSRFDAEKIRTAAKVTENNINTIHDKLGTDIKISELYKPFFNCFADTTGHIHFGSQSLNYFITKITQIHNKFKETRRNEMIKNRLSLISVPRGEERKSIENIDIHIDLLNTIIGYQLLYEDTQELKNKLKHNYNLFTNNLNLSSRLNEINESLYYKALPTNPANPEGTEPEQ